MKAQTLLLALLLSACGAEDKGQPPQSTIVHGDQASEGGASDLKALYIDKPENRPTCVDGGEGQLIYLVSDKAFYVCHGAAWVLIDINGKDGRDGRNGEDGENGLAGAAGKDGRDGTDGVDGKNGRDGRDGQDYHDSSDLWFDPMTGASWLKLAGNFTKAEATIACAGGYRLPTAQEAHDATLRGLAREYYGLTYQNPVPRMWVTDVTESGYGMSIDLVGASPSYATARGTDPTAKILGYCIKGSTP